MNGNECSETCLFKIIVYKSPFDSQFTITLLLGKLTIGMKYLRASFVNNITNFNKYICSIGTALRSYGEEPEKILPQLFTTYAHCSSDNGPFTCYIEMLENQYNDETINL